MTAGGQGPVVVIFNETAGGEGAPDALAQLTARVAGVLGTAAPSNGAAASEATQILNFGELLTPKGEAAEEPAKSLWPWEPSPGPMPDTEPETDEPPPKGEEDPKPTGEEEPAPTGEEEPPGPVDPGPVDPGSGGETPPGPPPSSGIPIRFDYPMAPALRDRWPEFFLPGLEGLEQDSVSLLETNPAFVAASWSGSTTS